MSFVLPSVQARGIIIRHLIILVFIQSLSAYILAIQHLPSHIASIPLYIYPTIIKSISKWIQQNIFLWPYVKYYDEVLDLFCSCSRANISIIKQFMRLTVHFYSELTSNHHVCNHFLLWSCGIWSCCLLLLKYAMYSLLYCCTNKHFRCTHSSQENHILTVFYCNCDNIVIMIIIIIKVAQKTATHGSVISK